MLIDTHAHLTDKKYGDDLEDVLSRAAARGVTAIVDVGDSLASSRRCLEHSRRYGGVFAAVGIHPHHAGEEGEVGEGEIAALADEPGVVAIGEIGLDFCREYAPRERQERLFRGLLRVAVEKGLPVIMHCRDAYPAIISVLRDMRGEGLRGVLHCFSGSSRDADRVVEMGYSISVGGPLTYPGSGDLRETVSQLPLEKVVLETDCPYLSPQPRRGRRNEPANLVFVAEELARLRGMTPEAVAEITSANARRLFDRMAAA